MSKKDEALRLALETLEELDGIDTETECVTIDVSDVMAAVREALAEPPAQQQEPVAVVSGYYGGQCVITPINPAMLFNAGTALYTSRKPWDGLTDEECEKIWRNLPYEVYDKEIRMIEQIIKEKNT